MNIKSELHGYASNPGYSHNDYADCMRLAADRIEELERQNAEAQANIETLRKALQFYADGLSDDGSVANVALRAIKGEL